MFGGTLQEIYVPLSETKTHSIFLHPLTKKKKKKKQTENGKVWYGHQAVGGN